MHHLDIDCIMLTHRRYERVVTTVYKKGRQGAAAKQIIAWVAYAQRPLTWGEVQALFFVDPSKCTADYHGKRKRQSCKELCGSLVDTSINNGEPEAETVLTLVHETGRR